MFFKRYCLFFVLLMLAEFAFSQKEKQYAFTHFSTTNGLVSNSVYQIVQDKQGYIWLGTIDGLQRYDGNRFLTFRHSSTDANSIPSDFIPQLTQDKDDNLWLYTGGKIGFFNTKNFRFTSVAIEGEDVNNPYDVKFYGPAANGYVALYIDNKGFYIYDPAAKIFKQKISFRLPDKQRVYAVQSIDNGQSYWLTTFGGLVIYNSKTGNLNYRGHNPDKNIYIDYFEQDTLITHFYARQNDTLWYGNWPLVAYAPFIFKANLKSGEKKKYSISKQFNFGYIEIGGALFQQNGRKWFYGTSFIAEYLGKDSVPFQLIPNDYSAEQNITYDHVFKMIEDRQHNIWVATDNGVFVFNPDMQVFNNYKLQRGTGKPTYAATTDACELKNGNVFITTWGSGLYYYDNKFNALPLPPALQEFAKTYMIWCVHEHTKTGLIWMGMQFGDINVYDPVRKKVETIHEKLLQGKTIRQVTEDFYGNLWFGLQNGGVVKWDMKAANNDVHKGYQTIKEKGPYYIQKMYTGKDGTIWEGCFNDGLYRYDPVTNKILYHYKKEKFNNGGLWSDGVNDICVYNDSLILIADNALDILNIKTNKITHISTENGLPSNTVVSIEADDKGILWLGMANQLCRFDLTKKIFSTFDRRDGISYDLFNTGADYKMKDGRLVYLTDKNFIAFNPASVSATAKPGYVAITNFSLGNKSLQVDSLNKLSVIDLDYNNTSVSIEFSALNYTPQNKLRYYYMLDGIDKNWQQSINRNEAVYNYLPAGDYTFKIKSENTEGKQSATTELHIHVVPPFWQTWWFLGFIILAVFATFYFIDRERIKKLQALQNVRRQIAQNLHNDVNTTLNHISLLSEMAKIKADQNVERSKEYIGQISDKSRTMIDSMDDMLWTLNPQNDSMEKTILRMKEYAEAVQNSFPVKVFMEVDEKVNDLKLDMKVRHEMFVIFKKVLRTIGEEANNSESFINVDEVGKKLLFKIQNSEVKFSGTNTEQIISDITHRAKSIKAELDIQNDSKGISFIMLVPL